MSQKWLQVIFAKETEPVEILIYDQIGKDWFTNDGIAAKEFADELKAIPAGRDIVVGINSPGGNVWDGLAIHNMLAARKGKVTTRNDGIAASIASIILMAGNERQSNKGALVMIHRAWGLAMGNAEDMTKMAGELEKHDGVLAGIYADVTGKSKDEVLKAMADETWFTAQEAKDFGLIGSILDKPNIQNAIDRSKLARWAETFKNFKNAPPAVSIEPTPPTPPEPNQDPTIMNRQQMLALLKKWGVEHKADITDADLFALVEAGKPTPAPAPAPAPAASANDDRIAKLEKRLAKEREDNITRRLDQAVVDNRITREEADAMKDVCINKDDDGKILSAIEKRQPQLPGAAPIATPNIRFGAEGARDHVMAMKLRRDRHEFMKNNWHDLLAAGYRNPNHKPIIPGIQAANTTDAALVTDFLVAGAETFLQNQLAAISCFAKQVEPDRVKPKATVQNRLVTAGGTAQSNATNFEDSTNFVATEDNRPITMAQLTAGSHVTNVERQNGVMLDQWNTVKLGELSDKIAAARNAIILEGTYTATPVVSSAAGFGADELATLWGQLKKSRIHNIALDGEYYARFLPTDRFDFEVTGFRNRGWDNFVMDTYWTGATANTVGFACNPQAMVCASGLPLREPVADLVSRETVVPLPALGISVALYEWYSNATRTCWATWDIVIGFGSMDATAGVLIKSA